jgi:hypothetical protein
MPIIPALRRLRQESCEFEASLGYTEKPCLKKQNKKVPLNWMNKKLLSENKCHMFSHHHCVPVPLLKVELSLTLARQALYHLSCSTTLFVLVILSFFLFWLVVLDLAPKALSWLGRCLPCEPHPQPCTGYSWVRVLLYAQAGLDHDPPICASLHSWGWQAHATTHSHWLNWGLGNFLPRLALNCDPLNLCLPSS